MKKQNQDETPIRYASADIKDFKEHAFSSSVSFIFHELENGESIAIVAPVGSGKTHLAHAFKKV